jgi:hypothetical protein
MSSASSNMTRQSIHNTHLPDTACLYTVKKYSMQHRMKHILSWKNSVSAYRKSQDPYCTIYARAVDPPVIMPLSDIATEQTKATEKTQAATKKLLDYLSTHSDATIR